MPSDVMEKNEKKKCAVPAKDSSVSGRALFWLGMFCAAVFFASLFIGAKTLNMMNIAEWIKNPYGSTDAYIFFFIRIPRVLLVALAGASLAASGLVFQAVLRNSLATPFTLGISGGSSLGAVLAIKFGFDFAFFGFSTVALCALAGAVLSLAFVYLLSKKDGELPSTTLILAGIGINLFFSSLVMVIHFFSDFSESYRIVHWLMGSFDAVNYATILRICFSTFLSLAVIFYYSKSLNLFSMGRDVAKTLGVNVPVVEKITLFSASLATASIISVAGPVSFIGLIIPHVMRLILGPDNRILVPASVLAGAGFLIVCDTVARTAFLPVELPVGVITSLCGGPFFVWLLKRRKWEITL